MAKLPLPRAALLRNLLRYDPETGLLFWREREATSFNGNPAGWNASNAGRPAFETKDGYGYKRGQVCGAQIRAHRVIWAIVTGEWPNGQIDHINGQRLDNRWANLREVSTRQNSRNKKRSARNQSGHNGVSWDKGCSKWRVHVGDGGKAKYIGVYASLEDAVRARKNAAADLGYTPDHGDRL